MAAAFHSSGTTRKAPLFAVKITSFIVNSHHFNWFGIVIQFLEAKRMNIYLRKRYGNFLQFFNHNDSWGKSLHSQCCRISSKANTSYLLNTHWTRAYTFNIQKVCAAWWPYGKLMNTYETQDFLYSHFFCHIKSKYQLGSCLRWREPENLGKTNAEP